MLCLYFVKNDNKQIVLLKYCVEVTLCNHNWYCMLLALVRGGIACCSVTASSRRGLGWRKKYSERNKKRVGLSIGNRFFSSDCQLIQAS